MQLRSPSGRAPSEGRATTGWIDTIQVDLSGSARGTPGSVRWVHDEGWLLWEAWDQGIAGFHGTGGGIHKYLPSLLGGGLQGAWGREHGLAETRSRGSSDYCWFYFNLRLKVQTHQRKSAGLSGVLRPGRYARDSPSEVCYLYPGRWGAAFVPIRGGFRHRLIRRGIPSPHRPGAASSPLLPGVHLYPTAGALRVGDVRKDVATVLRPSNTDRDSHLRANSCILLRPGRRIRLGRAPFLEARASIVRRGVLHLQAGNLDRSIKTGRAILTPAVLVSKGSRMR